MSAVSANLGLGQEQIRELFDLFLEEGLRHLRTIDEALPAADAQRVQLAAHTIKGGAAMLGFNEIEASAYNLERLAREQHLAQASPSVATLRAGLQSLADYLGASAKDTRP